MRSFKDASRRPETGIDGAAVAAKIGTLSCQRQRELLAFIHGMSWSIGLKHLSVLLIEAFPERIGSKTMRETSQSRRPLSKAQCLAIRDELDMESRFPLKGDWDLPTPREEYERQLEMGYQVRELVDQAQRRSDSLPERYGLEVFMERCVQLLRIHLPAFLLELCVNKDLHFAVSGDSTKGWFSPGQLEAELWIVYDAFTDIIGALCEFQGMQTQKAKQSIAQTEVGKRVWATLEAGLSTGKIVILEGESGIGKTTAAEAWVESNQGRARFVSLPAIVNRSSFFGALCRACGLNCDGKGAQELQVAVEDFLDRTGLMLVIDEAHYLLSGALNPQGHPTFIAWLYTALENRRVAVGLLCTEEFGVRMRRCNAAQVWNGKQFARRVEHYEQLPKCPTAQDVESVARFFVPHAGRSLLRLLVAHARASDYPLSELPRIIRAAATYAGRSNRSQVETQDVEAAVAEMIQPTALALRGLAQPAQDRGTSAARQQTGCTVPAGRLQGAGPGVARDGFEETFPASISRLDNQSLALDVGQP